MTEGVVFIGAAIIAATQFVKYLAPTVNGAVTIAVAVVIGVLTAVLDNQIGVVDLTVAQGIILALAAVGVHTTARNVSIK